MNFNGKTAIITDGYRFDRYLHDIRKKIGKARGITSMQNYIYHPESPEGFYKVFGWKIDSGLKLRPSYLNCESVII